MARFEVDAEHRVILHLAAELRGLTDVMRTRADASDLHHLVLRLDRLMARHLEREDAEVYPALAACADEEIRTLARDAMEDMGGLHEAWKAFVASSGPDDVLKDPPRFRAGCAAVLGALAERIRFEDERLYPLAARSGTLSLAAEAA